MGAKPIRQARIEGNIAYIPLTLGHEVIIDTFNLHLVDKWNWYAKKHGNTAYAYRSTKSSDTGWSLLMHRVIVAASVNQIVDHINGNGLDNRMENLRIVTKSQNGMNARLRSDSKSGYKGVYFCSREKRWVARIRKDSKSLWLGYHDSAEAAYSAYCNASDIFHNSFGRKE